jgi:Raf kinase inhibitor-like YbhB/YbcL family protein
MMPTRKHLRQVAFVFATIAAIATEALAQNPPGGAPPSGRGGGGRGGRGGVRIMTLTMPGFKEGGLMPAKYTQAGQELSPPLSWSGGPDSGIVSYALVAHDASAPVGNGMDDVLHWLVWNIPGTTTSLPEGVPQGPQLPDGTRQISVSGPYYRGPGAAANGPVHYYMFELYALDSMIDVQPVGATPAATRAAVMAAMAGHVRGKAVLVATYKRAP